MKTLFLSLSLVALIAAAPLSSAHAQAAAKSALPVAALRSIRENAEAAQQNANIYQWARVNREVDRVVADARKVQKALSADSALAKQGQEFADAVSALRSARLAHSPERIAAAADKLAALCESLLKN